jgi:hypothetical protein
MDLQEGPAEARYAGHLAVGQLGIEAREMAADDLGCGVALNMAASSMEPSPGQPPRFVTRLVMIRVAVIISSTSSSTRTYW